MDFKIYALREASTHNIRYIGLTRRSLPVRLRGHLKDERRNEHKRRWIKKCKGVEIVLLEGGITTLKEANEKERQYIFMMKAMGANLLNKTNGGDGTEGTKAWNKGIGCTYIDKLRQNSPKAKKVYAYDLEGNFIEEYNSVKEASQKTKVKRHTVVFIANELVKYKQGKGFQFRFFKSENIGPVKYDEAGRIEKVKNSRQKTKANNL